MLNRGGVKGETIYLSKISLKRQFCYLFVDDDLVMQ